MKPQSFVRKTLIPTRAWRGINYGRSVSVPGAYNVFVKSTGRVHVTSDAYFTERYTLGPRLRKQELRGLLQFLKLLKENYLLDYLLIALISRFLRAQGRLSLLYFLNVGVS